MLGADPPLGGRLAGTLEVREQVVRRADRNGVVFVDEMHAVCGL
jgi:ATP-dependent protease HslVU (ClpYQ) ATPase subunit